MKDLIERQAAIDAVLGACKDTATTECAVRELEELPPAQPITPCYLDSPCEYQNKDIKLPPEQPTQTNMPNALKALDCVERQAAIDAICKEWCGVAHKDCRCPFDPTVDDGYWCDGCESALITLPQLPSAEPEIIRCEDCMHNGSFDTDCPIGWNGKEYCSFAERWGE